MGIGGVHVNTVVEERACDPMMTPEMKQENENTTRKGKKTLSNRSV